MSARDLTRAAFVAVKPLLNGVAVPLGAKLLPESCRVQLSGAAVIWSFGLRAIANFSLSHVNNGGPQNADPRCGAAAFVVPATSSRAATATAAAPVPMRSPPVLVFSQIVFALREAKCSGEETARQGAGETEISREAGTSAATVASAATGPDSRLGRRGERGGERGARRGEAIALERSSDSLGRVEQSERGGPVLHQRVESLTPSVAAPERRDNCALARGILDVVFRTQRDFPGRCPGLTSRLISYFPTA
ncbi:unnamed protein product [Lampetra fluviatilis]